MYTLRIIRKSDALETNFNLGESYVYAHRKTSPKAFDVMYDEVLGADAMKPPHEDTFGYIKGECGCHHFLEVGNWYFIVSESGSTIAAPKP